MNERDEDAVVERVALAWGLPRPTVKGVLGSLRPGDRLPGGGVWMPEEATEAMWRAGAEAFFDATVGHVSGDLDSVNKPFIRYYRAMIRAASEEPKP